MLDHRAKIRAFATVGALLVAAWAALAAPSPVSAGPATDTDTTTVTDFHWEAPKNLTGDFIAVLNIETDEPRYCQWHAGVTVRGKVDNPILLWSRGVTARGEVGGPVWNPEYVQAHAGNILNTRVITHEDGQTWAGKFSGSTVGTEPWGGDTLTITVAGFGLEHWEEASQESPYVVDLSCDGPVRMTLEAGRVGLGFTHQTFTHGGAGASTETAVQVGDTTVGYTRAYRDARLGQVFATEEVRFAAHFNTYGGDIGVEPDRLALAHPTGTQTWTLSDGEVRRNQSTTFRHIGGHGSYVARLDLTRTNEPNYLKGVLVGVDPVASLDEAVEG